MTEQISSSKQTSPGAFLRCIGCAAACEQATANFRCPRCGDLLEVAYSGWSADGPAIAAGLDAPALKSLWRKRRTSLSAVDQSGVWRFREVLPALQDWDRAITIREGNTPVYELPHCAMLAGMQRLLAKHQGMNPTGSFKDTGMTVAASFARQQGFRWVACASTGNTSASMAAYAARASMRALVLIPEGKISWSKLSQSLDYGAVTCQVKTDFDGCMRVLNEVVQRLPVYLLNSVNPYRLEGQKTAAIELMEQLDWRVPDHVIVPGGNLGNSSALGKAFLEMKQLGLISSLPRLSVVQAAGANPFTRMIREGRSEIAPAQAETMATAIRIGNPASWKKALRAVQGTGGTVEDVSEIEIALAKSEIGADGIGCEPASAVTFAGLKKLIKRGVVQPRETVVLILTGHLLKDPDFTLRFHRGDLFDGNLDQKEMALLAASQRAPKVLDANADAVLRVLEVAEKNGAPN